MAGSTDNSSIVRFGLFELDLQARELRKSGIRIKLQDQPFQILALLLERPGEIVTREQLQTRLWPADTFVDFDLSLNSAIKKLRQALNDDSENPRFIETLYRRGYRFIAPVNGSAGSGQMALMDRFPAPPAESISTYPRSSMPIRTALVAAVLIVLIAVASAYRMLSSHPPRVLGFTQITHDGLPKNQLFTDGQRLYFQELQVDHFVVGQVSVTGGETSVIPSPFANVVIGGMQPNGSALYIGTFRGTDMGTEGWLLPLPSGSPRRLGEIIAASVAWAPDGSEVVFSRGNKIYVARTVDSQPQELATTSEPAYAISFSPDSRKLRFNLIDPRNNSSSMWEMSRNGSGLRQLLAGWSTDEPHECCGSWTPDGRYFIFQAYRDGRDSIFAMREKGSWLDREPKPVALTNGPLEFESPILSRDGKRIFAVGSQPRCEMMRYENKSGFAPIMDGQSVSDLAFSADGKWVAYVTVPDRQLWRSRVDGSEKLALSPAGFTTGMPRWSPDGKQLAFMGASSKTGFLAYLISSDGTGMRELIPGTDAGYDPNWSNDGKFIVLTLNVAGSPELVHLDGPGIVTYELETKKIAPLPDAKQLFSPRWSPDGRYIAAVTDDSLKLMLFDRVTQQWQELVRLPIGYPSWSHDGQYIYFDTTLIDDPAFFRVRISDHKLERLLSLKGTRQYWGPFGSWTGLAPDDSPLIVRDISNQEIYALEWQAP